MADDLSDIEAANRQLWPKRVVKDGVTTEFFSPAEVIEAQRRQEEISAAKRGLNGFKRYKLVPRDPFGVANDG